MNRTFAEWIEKDFYFTDNNEQIEKKDGLPYAFLPKGTRIKAYRHKNVFFFIAENHCVMWFNDNWTRRKGYGLKEAVDELSGLELVVDTSALTIAGNRSKFRA